MSILNFWPFKNSPPRKTQIEVLKWIESLPSDIKYIICEIPVGGGKSPIALNVSAWMDGISSDGCKNSSIGNSFILTPQKILQKQYEDSFPNMAYSFYGKSNYNCAIKGTNCEIGNLVKPLCKPCCHKIAYDEALSSRNLIMNYTLAITYKLTPADLMKKRKLMVFDECHNIEKQLIDIFGVFISKKSCARYICDYKKPKNLSEAYNFISKEYRNSIISFISNQQIVVDEILHKISSGTNPSKTDMAIVDELEKTKKHLIMVNLLLDKPKDKFISEHVLIEHPESFEIKELYARNIFSSFFDDTADKFLFMSSTILDKDEFCSDLGIDASKTAFISMPSEFDVDNRLVIFNPVAKMTYGWDSKEREPDRKAMIKAIQTICNDLHGSDNGVIHTGSYQVSNWLVRDLQGKIPHRIYHHNSDIEESRGDVINNFIMDDIGTPKILISPSVTEGLDLKDNLGRFSIIAKTPYPYLGDAWVKKRSEISQKWYMLQAMKSVIQASGRVVRNREDWGTTYILDESFSSLYSRMKKYIPEWWNDAFERM
jgi:Rad3-related DNA helicase